jgi:uncharacterized membrane protein
MARPRALLRYLSAEDIRATLWFWPSVAAVLALGVGVALVTIRPDPESGWARALWPGDGSSASAVLQVVASSLMAATALTFSLTVVAIQLASQQFSPRLLREFARDRFIQRILALFVSTFVLALVGLRALDAEHAVPVVLVAVVFVLGLGSAGALLALVGHIARILRVDTMMAAVHQECAAIIAEYPAYSDRSRQAEAAALPPGLGALVPAARSGFVRVVRRRAILADARRLGFFVRIDVRAGDHLVIGAPLGVVWPLREEAGYESAAVRAVQDAVELGFERTAEQDAALGLRQLTDIAVKALSPAINDPVTATHALGYCGDLIVRLQGRRLGPQQRADRDGVVRVQLAERTHRYFLDEICGPVRRYGSREPLVLVALLRMLRDCAMAARDDTQRHEIRRQCALVLDAVPEFTAEADEHGVRDLARRVELALVGDLRGAYVDVAGETRSV